MSPIPIVVQVEVPSYRMGLMTAFAEAGFPTEEPDDVRAWVTQPGRRGVVINIEDAEGCKALAALSRAGVELTILALLGNPTVDLYREALRHGASAAVAWDADFETILWVFTAAAEFMTTVPVAVMQSLLGDDAGMTVMEEQWVKMIGAGRSVGDIAQKVGYSERDMLHVLHRLYERLGMNHAEA